MSNTRSMTGTMRLASMARAASAKSATEPVLLPMIRSPLTIIGSKSTCATAPLTRPTVNTVPPTAAALSGKRKRGRKLSDGGARARFYREVCDEHLARIIQIDLKSELFTYTINERALTHARMMDGKLLLVTNTKDLAPAEVVRRYKSLADIERGFRVLKSEIEIGPIYHRLPDRISAPTRSPAVGRNLIKSALPKSYDAATGKVGPMSF